MQYPQDIALDENRDIIISDDSHDAVLTNGFEVVQQTAAVACGNVVRSFVGEAITGKNLENLRSTISGAIRAEPLFLNTARVEIIEIDRTTDTVTVRVTTTVDKTFLITV